MSHKSHQKHKPHGHSQQHPKPQHPNGHELRLLHGHVKLHVPSKAPHFMHPLDMVFFVVLTLFTGHV